MIFFSKEMIKKGDSRSFSLRPEIAYRTQDAEHGNEKISHVLCALNPQNQT